MSRIFDALKRSEGERKGDEAATMPEGPELLQRAEHRFASSQEIAASLREQEGAQAPELA